MKIIDLLNKIANEEDVPKYIEYQDSKYEYVYMWEQYVMTKTQQPLLTTISSFNYSGLNDEVEILDEDKKIEELNIELNADDNNKINCYRAKNLEMDLAYKINELVREVNRIKENKGE